MARRADETPPTQEAGDGGDVGRIAARRPDHYRPTSVVTGPDYARQKIDLDGPAGSPAPDKPPKGPETPPAEEPPTIPFENTKVLARVGNEVILAGDVLPSAIEAFNERKKRVPPEHHDQLFQQAVISQVMSLVKVKLLYTQARRKIPEDKLPEVKKKIDQGFEDNALKHFMKNENCKTRQELDDKLKQTGNSIDRVKRNFVEAQIAQQWFNDQVKEDDQKVTHDEMLARYREKLATYEHPASATYEELMVKLSKYGSKAEAHDALAEMGNQVYKGAPFAEVAKARSDGSTAAEGGRKEIRKDSHVSRVVDEAIFSLPVGAMSPILEDLDPKLKDRRGYYIIRVVQRRGAWTTPFTEVQATLAEEIKRERIRDKQTAYMKKIFAETPPWTIFDGPSVANKGQPAETPGKIRR